MKSNETAIKLDWIKTYTCIYLSSCLHPFTSFAISVVFNVHVCWSSSITCSLLNYHKQWTYVLSCFILCKKNPVQLQKSHENLHLPPFPLPITMYMYIFLVLSVWFGSLYTIHCARMMLFVQIVDGKYMYISLFHSHSYCTISVSFKKIILWNQNLISREIKIS